MSLRLFAAALVCGSVALPIFSQSLEEEPQKNPFRMLSEIPWGPARMVLPDSLKTDVVTFGRRRFITPGQPVAFPPYRLKDLKDGLSWLDMLRVFGGAVEMAVPDSLKTDVLVFESNPDSTPARPLEFLPYGVSHLKHGLSWDEMFELFDAELQSGKDPQSFSFTLSKENTGMWQVGCRWTPIPGDWSYQGRRFEEPADPVGVITIQCRLTSIGSDQRWTLELETSGLVKTDGNRPGGRLTNGKGVYQVSPSYAEELKFLDLVPLAGYLFSVDGEPVAAATSNRLIFRKSVTPGDRSLIAAAATSLSILAPVLDKNMNASVDPKGFSFTLSEEKTETERVACRVRRIAAAKVGAIDDRAMSTNATQTIVSIKCDLVSVGSDRRGTLELVAFQYAKPLSDETRSRGLLERGKTQYEVRPSYEVKSHFGIVRLGGYLFMRDQEPVAAVMTYAMEPLVFRSSVAPADRSLIAASACALILLTPLGVR
jgi:hypothetical protein